MRRDSFVAWTGRGLGLAMCGFFGLFALGHWEPIEFVMSLLPAAIVFATVALGWRRPLIGGLAFVALAVSYASLVPFRADWVLAISGPLMVIALFHFWTWRIERARRLL